MSCNKCGWEQIWKSIEVTDDKHELMYQKERGKYFTVVIILKPYGEDWLRPFEESAVEKELSELHSHACTASLDDEVRVIILEATRIYHLPEVWLYLRKRGFFVSDESLFSNERATAAKGLGV